MTNKVGTHKCNSTCLKYTGSKSKQRQCRFHFGKFDEESKKSEGKTLHPFYSLITPGQHPRFEGNREHTHLISHIKPRL